MTIALPIRIIFCITDLDAGGAERALTQLVLNLNRDEWDPYVICLGPRGHFADTLETARIPVQCLNASGVFSLPTILFRLTQAIHRLRPAVVQTFLFHANILGRLAARFSGVQVVVSGLRVAERRSPWYGRLDRWTNSLVTMNVCVSEGVAHFAEEISGITRRKLVVIPNGVDIENFASARPADLRQLGIPAHSRVFITIGRLERQKGIDVLLDAVIRARPLPDDVHFLIVGDGPQLNELRVFAERNGLSATIHFAGRRTDVPQLLAAATALVLPSRWEGMPNVVLEAMAASLPVIATRVEGILELVREEATGLIVAPEDPDALAAALARFLADPEFATSAGEEAQRVISQNFTLESTARSYSRLYLKLLDLTID